MSINKFVGNWEIFAMEDFDEDYMNAGEIAFIKIGKSNRGKFKFGYVEGELQGKLKSEDIYEFKWEGTDELDEVDGDGIIKIMSNNNLEGEINFFTSDKYKFQARRK